MSGAGRPTSARQLSPVTPHRALPVRKSEAAQLPRSPQTSEAVAEPSEAAIEAARRGLAALRVPSNGSFEGKEKPSSPSQQKKG
jgi:hypothetical protein